MFRNLYRFSVSKVISYNFCVVKEVIKKSVLAKCKIKKETSTGKSYLFANLVHVPVVVGSTLLRYLV